MFTCLNTRYNSEGMKRKIKEAKRNRRKGVDNHTKQGNNKKSKFARLRIKKKD